MVLKRMEKMLDEGNSKMQRVVLNKYWKEHPPQKTAALRTVISHLTNDPSMNKTYDAQLEKSGRTHKR